MYNNEESLVLEEFNKRFGEKRELLLSILDTSISILFQVKTPPNEFNKYSAVMLAGLNIKSISSAFDRLSKGYLSDSEAILKKIIESFIAEIYFYEHPEIAKEWCLGKSINDICPNRRIMAQELDLLNAEKHFFPTDHPKYFEEYIYEVGYQNSNKVAHLDFDFVHNELGLENDPSNFAYTLVVGPRFEPSFMETTLNRLTIFCMFQLTFIKETFGIQDLGKKYEEVFGRVRDTFLSEKSSEKDNSV